MDGVLEVKNAHFWSTGFNSTAGTIHVRVSRNTNQQQVLAHIILKVYPIVPNCDIQVRFFIYIFHNIINNTYFFV